jgi:hypothetical protein
LGISLGGQPVKHRQQEIQRQEQEALKHYMSHFSVDQQGKVTKIKDVTFDSPQSEVKTDVSKQPALDTEIANMVDGAVTAHLNNKLDFVGQNLHSIFDARFSRIEAHLGMKSIGNDKHASTSGTDKAVGSSATEGIPASLYSSAPNASVPYGTASSLRHVSTPLNHAQPYSTPIANQPRAEDVGSGNLKEEVIKIFRQTFGIETKVKCRSYQKPYPDNYEFVAYTQGFRIPEFVKFTGDDSRTPLEHIGQFMIQCGEASTNDICKLKLFPLSLSGAAFTWFISLPPNSVYT